MATLVIVFVVFEASFEGSLLSVMPVIVAKVVTARLLVVLKITVVVMVVFVSVVGDKSGRSNSSDGCSDGSIRNSSVVADGASGVDLCRKPDTKRLEKKILK